jgi:hypothetical protein
MGWRDPDRARAAVAAWQNFVSECKAGYSLGLFEYRHDLRIRDLLEVVIQDPKGVDASAFHEFTAEVRRIDDEFRLVLDLDRQVTPDVRWWHQYLPAYGGEYLVEDVQELHGVHIAESAV